MACHTTLFLYWRVLKDKGPGGVNVAFCADQSLPRRRLQLVRQKGPMRIVAIRTGHQTFIHAVMLRFGEIRLDTLMAAVAQSGLRRHKQVLGFRGMDGMTSSASDTIRQVG